VPSVTHSKDMMGPPKFKMGCVNMTPSFSGVVCLP